jgi:methyltransferase (TIGR00027 family)
LRELNVALPSNLAFVPINFEQQTLREVLRAGGYRAEEAAFFSWLGGTQYHIEDAILRTLQEVASSAPGSEIVFEYSLPEDLLAGKERQYLAACKTAAERGEPWLSFFGPSRLAAQVKELGFTEVSDFSPEEANARYFANRTDGLRIIPRSSSHESRVGSLS